MTDVSVGGTAIVRTFTNGSVVHYLYGNLHRTDGPAVIDRNGSGDFWVRGYCFEEHEQAMLRRQPAHVLQPVLELYRLGGDVGALIAAVKAAVVVVVH